MRSSSNRTQSVFSYLVSLEFLGTLGARLSGTHLDSLAGFLPQTPFLLELLPPPFAEIELLRATQGASPDWCLCSVASSSKSVTSIAELKNVVPPLLTPGHSALDPLTNISKHIQDNFPMCTSDGHPIICLHFWWH